MAAQLPIVAVVGRPNVGKSTLFNRVVSRRLAIVDDRPGVTRDRNFARAEWAGRRFFIVDTGGVIEGSAEPLDRAVREQALAAVDEAHVILFLVDARSGPHPLDERLADVLRRSARSVLLVVNKVDNLPADTSSLDFWSLGMGEPVPVAAASGKGTGDLLDRVVSMLPPAAPDRKEEHAIRVAVVGKPNVGKSSFVNRLFGEERVVVSEAAGTTRDPVDTPLVFHARTLVFVDTAGLRRQSRIKDSLEYYSVLRAARVLQEADVALVLVDASEPLHVQDLKVAEMAWEAGCGMVLVVNKWDLVEKDTQTAPHSRNTRVSVPASSSGFPSCSRRRKRGSASTRHSIWCSTCRSSGVRRIDTHEVNKALEELMRRQPPPHSRGRPVKLRYGTQVGVEPPAFVLFANLPRDVPDHYIRYVMNGFRERWGFLGVAHPHPAPRVGSEQPHRVNDPTAAASRPARAVPTGSPARIEPIRPSAPLLPPGLVAHQLLGGPCDLWRGPAPRRKRQPGSDQHPARAGLEGSAGRWCWWTSARDSFRSGPSPGLAQRRGVGRWHMAQPPSSGTHSPCGCGSGEGRGWPPARACSWGSLPGPCWQA